MVIDFAAIWDTIVQGNVVFIAFAICIVALFSGFVFFMSWKKRKILNALQHMKLSGTTFLIGPEIGSYRGATSVYGKVKCDGIIALTETSLVFLPYIGKKKEIALHGIRGIEVVKTFLGQYRAGIPVLVLHHEQCDIGFFVQDTAAWLTAIRNLTQRKKEVS